MLTPVYFLHSVPAAGGDRQPDAKSRLHTRNQ